MKAEMDKLAEENQRKILQTVQELRKLQEDNLETMRGLSKDLNAIHTERRNKLKAGGIEVPPGKEETESDAEDTKGDKSVDLEALDNLLEKITKDK
ncbi:MAG: hypothetical protein GY765_17880 [bacterium]|nr:hypothetical protein [bacterium]